MQTISSTGLLTLLFLLSSCGGGGGSSNGAPPPVAPPAPVPQGLSLADALPSDSATNVDPNTKTLRAAHRGPSDLSFSYTGDCGSGTVVTRRLIDLNSTEQSTLYAHQLACPNLGANSQANTSLLGQLSNGDEYELSLNTTTSTAGTSGLLVQDTVSSARATVEDTFTDFLAMSVLPDLGLPGIIENLILASAQLLFSSWTNLLDPSPLYGVTSQRVAYLSSDPLGNQTASVTGLIVRPDTTGAFTPRDRVVVLMHSTGSTPGDLDPANTWFGVANLLAARGYLVIAADNWGRGGTTAEDETYLLGSRTANNTRDLLAQLLADPSFDSYRNPGQTTQLTIIGYSQGGHSAMALWESLAAAPLPDVRVREIYAGGGPHNLYATFAGVVTHLDGSCNNAPYCQYVDADTSVPFATNRILPGYLSYTNSGTSAAQAIDGDSLATGFVNDFLANEPSLDQLKLLLQLNSYTNITNVSALFSDPDATLILYHTPYDRLVPEANTAELLAAFQSSQTVQYRASQCSDSEYETIFNATSFVGINHTLCGLDMINDVLSDLQ